jgi:DNA ligase (NAD+)
MEGFQKKSAEKVVAEIAATVAKADCLAFMDASNLFGRSIGTKKLKLILTTLPKIFTGYVPSQEELYSIDGIGSVTGKQFLEGLPQFFSFMKDAGIPCVAPIEEKVEGKTLNITVVFTGVRDKELEAEIEARGGKVSTSVSKNTNVVVAKDPNEDSGKIKTAKGLGIPVITIEQFKKDYM